MTASGLLEMFEWMFEYEFELGHAFPVVGRSCATRQVDDRGAYWVR